ncbi:MAG: peptidase [Deltaproteobacteria bacterium HGW-Deltaproteobacteria-19]|jgi:serine protease Do|nr:MAG: peptidase [Deltaproteobacteria bacterium HGW-Deltaproteobacteria-19]
MRIKRSFLYCLFLAGTILFAPGIPAATVDAAPAAASVVSGGFADLAERLSPAVVNISTTKTVKSGRAGSFGAMPQNPFFGDDFYRRFFGDQPNREYRQRGLGSGFIISRDGYIFTNNHVIAGADKILVKLAGGKEYPAEIVGRDANTDIALIKIKPDGDLPTAVLGDSDKLRVGDWVLAIGNPFGLEQTVTAGIVSAKARSIGAGPYDEFIQTDASINPGNSGGPLFNLKGEVVGINTAIVAQGQGIGFAVPVNMAKEIYNDLKTKGKVTRGWLGVSVQDLTDEMAASLKITGKQGALVGDVFPGEPADRAGIKTGDLIVEVGGKAVRNTHDLLRHVATLQVGRKVALKIVRDGRERTVEATVGERKDAREIARIGKGSEQFGMTVQEITPEMARHFGMAEKAGVIVTRVTDGSPAEEAGIQPQDIILRVNRTEIRSMKDYLQATAGVKEEDSLLILFRRGDSNFFITLKKKKTK